MFEDRILLVVRANRLRRAVSHFRIRSGVAQVAHAAQGQNRRTTPLAHPPASCSSPSTSAGRARTRSRTAAPCGPGADSTHPAGLGTLIPEPVVLTHREEEAAGHRTRSGTLLFAPRGVVGLSDASPKEQRRRRRAHPKGPPRRGGSHDRPRRLPRRAGATRSSRSSAGPRGSFGGRTPCLTAAIGSVLAAATTPYERTKVTQTLAYLRPSVARASRTRPTSSAGAPGRPRGAQARPRRGPTRAPPSRSCRSSHVLLPASV